MKLNFSFSPCPNDTFMFEAIVNKRIALEDYTFNIGLSDIETLNRNVLQGFPDVSKISVAVYPSIADKYQILLSGAALGMNNGPLLISKTPFDLSQINTASIAIPGIHTTANLLLSVAFPEAKNKTERIFSAIESAILNEQERLGLVIHESRFTYAQKGLLKVLDFGEYWETKYSMPLPLGVIVVKRSLPEKIKKDIEILITESIHHAFEYPEKSLSYIKQHAQEMDDDVIQKHISLYVNSYSKNMGTRGSESILFLFEKGKELGLFSIDINNIFLV